MNIESKQSLFSENIFFLKAAFSKQFVFGGVPLLVTLDRSFVVTLQLKTLRKLDKI